MARHTSLVSAATLTLLASMTAVSRADFTVSPPMMISAGAVGNASNSVYLHTYSGPDVIIGSSDFVGGLSPLTPATLASEARFNLRNTRFGTTGSVNVIVSRTGSMTGTVLIAATPGAAMILRDGDVLRFESYDSFDDAVGGDAAWTDVSWTFQTATVTDLGRFASISGMTTTGGSGFGTDTELAMYSDAGVLLRSNDDFNGGSGSGFSGLALADGVYYLVVTPYNTGFANGLASPGIDGTGPFTLSFDSVAVASGTLGTNSAFWYRFEIGPDCAADFNGDNTVDFFDYLDFVAAFSGGSTTADFNADTVVDFFDYLDFVAAFSTGC